MPTQQLANYVQTTLASGCTAVATTISVVSAAGLPTAGNFMVRIDDVAPATTFEYAECTAIAGTVLTVTRGEEGTTGIAHNAGAFVGNDITQAMLIRSVAMGSLGYAAMAGNQAGIVATQVDLTGMTKTVTPITAARLLKVTFLCLGFSSTVAGDGLTCEILKDGTPIGQVNSTYGSVGSFALLGIVVIDNPTLAAHTYKAVAMRFLGTGTITIYSPGFFLVEDIGQA